METETHLRAGSYGEEDDHKTGVADWWREDHKTGPNIPTQDGDPIADNAMSSLAAIHSSWQDLS